MLEDCPLQTGVYRFLALVDSLTPFRSPCILSPSRKRYHYKGSSRPQEGRYARQKDHGG